MSTTSKTQTLDFPTRDQLLEALHVLKRQGQIRGYSSDENGSSWTVIELTGKRTFEHMEALDTYLMTDHNMVASQRPLQTLENEEKRVVIKPDSLYGMTDFRGEPLGRRYMVSRFIDRGDRYFGAAKFDDLSVAQEYASTYLDKDTCFYTREDFFEENTDLQ
jgi:hypothetical protein